MTPSIPEGLEDRLETLKELDEELAQMSSLYKDIRSVQLKLTRRAIFDLMPRQKTSMVYRERSFSEDHGVTIRDGSVYEYGLTDKASRDRVSAITDHATDDIVNGDAEKWATLKDLTSALDYDGYDYGLPNRTEVEVRGEEIRYSSGKVSYVDLEGLPGKMYLRPGEDADEYSTLRRQLKKVARPHGDQSEEEARESAERILEFLDELVDELIPARKASLERARDDLDEARQAMARTTLAMGNEPTTQIDDLSEGDIVEVHGFGSPTPARVTEVEDFGGGHGRIRTTDTAALTFDDYGTDFEVLDRSELEEELAEKRDRMAEIEDTSRVPELQDEVEDADEEVRRVQKKLEEARERRDDAREELREVSEETGYKGVRDRVEELEELVEGE